MELYQKQRERGIILNNLKQEFYNRCHDRILEMSKWANFYKWLIPDETDEILNNVLIAGLKEEKNILITQKGKNPYTLKIKNIGIFKKMFTHKKSCDYNLRNLFHQSGLFNDDIQENHVYTRDELLKDIIQLIIYTKFFDLLDNLCGFFRKYNTTTNIKHLKLSSEKPIYLKLKKGDIELYYKIYLGAIAILIKYKNEKTLILKSIFVTGFKKTNEKGYNDSEIKLNFNLDSDEHKKQIENITQKKGERGAHHRTRYYRYTSKYRYRQYT